MRGGGKGGGEEAQGLQSARSAPSADRNRLMGRFPSVGGEAVEQSSQTAARR